MSKTYKEAGKEVEEWVDEIRDNFNINLEERGVWQLYDTDSLEDIVANIGKNYTNSQYTIDQSNRRWNIPYYANINLPSVIQFKQDETEKTVRVRAAVMYRDASPKYSDNDELVYETLTEIRLDGELYQNEQGIFKLKFVRKDDLGELYKIEYVTKGGGYILQSRTVKAKDDKSSDCYISVSLQGGVFDNPFCWDGSTLTKIDWSKSYYSPGMSGPAFSVSVYNSNANRDMTDDYIIFIHPMRKDGSINYNYAYLSNPNIAGEPPTQPFVMKHNLPSYAMTSDKIFYGFHRQFLYNPAPGFKDQTAGAVTSLKAKKNQYKGFPGMGYWYEYDQTDSIYDSSQITKTIPTTDEVSQDGYQPNSSRNIGLVDSYLYRWARYESEKAANDYGFMIEQEIPWPMIWGSQARWSDYPGTLTKFNELFKRGPEVTWRDFFKNRPDDIWDIPYENDMFTSTGNGLPAPKEPSVYIYQDAETYGIPAWRNVNKVAVVAARKINNWRNQRNVTNGRITPLVPRPNLAGTYRWSQVPERTFDMTSGDTVYGLNPEDCYNPLINEKVFYSSPEDISGLSDLDFKTLTLSLNGYHDSYEPPENYYPEPIVVDFSHIESDTNPILNKNFKIKIKDIQKFNKKNLETFNTSQDVAVPVIPSVDDAPSWSAYRVNWGGIGLETVDERNIGMLTAMTGNWCGHFVYDRDLINNISYFKNNIKSNVIDKTLNFDKGPRQPVLLGLQNNLLKTDWNSVWIANDIFQFDSADKTRDQQIKDYVAEDTIIGYVYLWQYHCLMENEEDEFFKTEINGDDVVRREQLIWYDEETGVYQHRIIAPYGIHYMKNSSDKPHNWNKIQTISADEHMFYNDLCHNWRANEAVIRNRFTKYYDDVIDKIEQYQDIVNDGTFETYKEMNWHEDNWGLNMGLNNCTYAFRFTITGKTLKHFGILEDVLPANSKVDLDYSLFEYRNGVKSKIEEKNKTKVNLVTKDVQESEYMPYHPKIGLDYSEQYNVMILK